MRNCRAQEPDLPSDNQAVTGSAFRFRLERVRAVRERKEKLAQRELADAISRRSEQRRRSCAAADAHLEHARQQQRSVTAEREAVSATDLLGRQAFLERVEAQRRTARQRPPAARGGGRRARRRAGERRQRARDAQSPQGAPPRRARPRGRSPRAGRPRRDRQRPLSRESRVSTQALSAAAGVPAGELAILQRVQQLQELIESSRQVVAGAQVAPPPPPAPPTRRPPAPTSPPRCRRPPAPTALLARPPCQHSSPGLTYDATQSAAQGASSGESSDYDPLIEQAAARNGLDPAVLHGLIEQESGFDPSATSSAGASGLTQLMPGTASSLGVANPLNPAESIEGGARYLGQLMSRVRRQHRRRARRLQRRTRSRPAVRRHPAVRGNPELRQQSARQRRSLPAVAPHHGATGASHERRTSPARAADASPATGLGGPARGPRPHPGHGALFQSALAEQSARTANAEGHSREAQ